MGWDNLVLVTPATVTQTKHLTKHHMFGFLDCVPVCTLMRQRRTYQIKATNEKRHQIIEFICHPCGRAIKAAAKQWWPVLWNMHGERGPGKSLGIVWMFPSKRTGWLPVCGTWGVSSRGSGSVSVARRLMWGDWKTQPAILRLSYSSSLALKKKKKKRKKERKKERTPRSSRQPLMVPLPIFRIDSVS